MDLQRTLTIITILGFALTCIAGVTSQLFKTSIEVNGQLTKQLTPAGWLSLGIALVALSSATASELMRVRIKHDEDLRKQIEAAQQKALQERETAWRAETSAMLSAANADISSNLEKTISGFARTQKDFNETQTQIVVARQSVIENSIRQMKDVILAGQPLTSLAFEWSFNSSKSDLRDNMEKGRAEILANAETSQGGVPEVPFDFQEYSSALIPLISWIASHGEKADEEEGGKEHDVSSTIVLMPLDDSPNAVLSFGMIPDGNGDLWLLQAKGDRASAISAGFAPGQSNARRGYSTPTVTFTSSGPQSQSMSTYSIRWSLDPSTLAASIDRINPSISSTGKLPSVLRLAIIRAFKDLPFERNNLAHAAAANLWRSRESDRKYLNTDKYFSDMMLSFEVNGIPDNNYNYVIRDVYTLALVDDADDEIEDARCMILEFARP